MLREYFEKWMNWLRLSASGPREKLDSWQRAVRYSYDLGRYGARSLRQDNAPQMAAALSYRVIFGLVPVFVVGTILVRAIGGFSQFQQRLNEFFATMGLNKFRVTPFDAAADETAVASQSLSDWLLDLIAQVEQINLAAITWVGVAVLVYSAVSLMVTIENSFNNIYGAPGGRSWLRRLPIYWTILTIGPAALALTMYLDNRFDSFVADAGGWWSIFRAAPVVWSCVATWFVMFSIYKLVPNTNVGYNPALIGAFVAAVLLEIGKRSLGAYFSNAVSLGQLYGSLGLIPLFMFWMYLMWLVVLFGLEVSATVQMVHGRKLDELEEKRQHMGLIDPAAVLSVMEIITERFGQSQATTARDVSDESNLPEVVVRSIFDRMVREGFLHRVDREEEAVSLALPPDQVSAEKLIAIGFSLADEGGVGRKSALLERLRDAQRRLAEKATLASLLPAAQPAVATDQASGKD